MPYIALGVHSRHDIRLIFSCSYIVDISNYYANITIFLNIKIFFYICNDFIRDIKF